MKIALVGPSHPYKGGIAQQTTALAHQLTSAGHEVNLINWKHQYPFFYPGQQFVPYDKPELPVFAGSKRIMSWRNPAGWLVAARKLKRYDEIIFVWGTPIVQGPVILSMLAALGKKGPKTVILCHNVVQHSATKADKKLANLAFNRADLILVHSEAQADLARSLTTTEVIIRKLPLASIVVPSDTDPNKAVRRHLLFFGLVRQYKGVDILVKALVNLPGVSLTIAGEMWGNQKEKLEQLITELGLEKRVTLQSGYVPTEDVAGLFAEADAQVLPYRSGTGSQMVDMAFSFGLPVIATRVGTLALEVHDGVDGLLCEPEDTLSLTAALQHFYEPGVAETLRRGIPTITVQSDWDDYVSALTAAS